MRFATFLTLLAPSIIALHARAQESLAILDAPVMAVPATQQIVQLLHLDGDGLLDFAVRNENSNGVGLMLCRNTGQGGLQGLISRGRGGPTYEHPVRMGACDVQGDGQDEVIWLEARQTWPVYHAGFMEVLGYDHARRWFVEFDHLDREGPIDFGTVLDVDLDGDADRVWIYAQTLTLDRFEPDGSGGWSATTTTLSLPFTPETLIRMDHDGDAYPDLYLNHGTSGAFVSLAGGALHAPVDLVHGIDSDMPMALPGDVDGDGDEDLALFDMGGYALYRRTDRRAGCSSRVASAVRPRSSPTSTATATSTACAAAVAGHTHTTSPSPRPSASRSTAATAISRRPSRSPAWARASWRARPTWTGTATSISRPDSASTSRAGR
jgi:hypothetical protein